VSRRPIDPLLLVIVVLLCALVAVACVVLVAPVNAQAPDVPGPRPQRPYLVDATTYHSVYWYETWPGGVACVTRPPLTVAHGTLSSICEPVDAERGRWTFLVQGAVRTILWDGDVIAQRVALPLLGARP